MACYKPKKGFYYGKTESGKDNVIVCDYSVDHIEVDGREHIHRVYDSEVNPAFECIRRYIEIPCQKCEGCRLDQARQFADRIFLESQCHEQNCFLTLTYEDKKLPFNPSVDKITGEILDDQWNATLRRKHLSEFIKALRNKLNYKGFHYVMRKGKKYKVIDYYKQGDPEFVKILYFGCGEYGSNTKRPHYHLIIFGWSPIKNDPDIKFVKKNDLDQPYYFSPYIDKIWDKGNNIVSDYEYNTGAYVARYVQSKVNLDLEFFEINNIEPEFTCCSTRPGIGKQWLEKNFSEYCNMSAHDFATRTGNKRIYKNRYFDRLVEAYDDDQAHDDYKNFFALKKERLKFNEARKELMMQNTELSYLEQLEVERQNFLNRTKILKRREFKK